MNIEVDGQYAVCGPEGRGFLALDVSAALLPIEDIVETVTISSAVSRLRSWLGNRVSWIDTQWLRPPRLSRPGGKINPGTTVSITGSGGTIYYTLNGADPRRSGGSTSTDAIQYSGSISLE